MSKSITTAINAKMKQEHTSQRRTQRLILMGMPSSGKSTILQQLQYIYCESSTHSTQFLQDKIREIRKRCCLNSLILCLLMNDIKYYKTLSKLSIENEHDSHKIATIINNVWKRNRAKHLYSQRWINTISTGNITMDDNMDKYFDNIDTIMSADYIPTREDLLLSPQHCNYLQTLNYELKESLFEGIDVPSKFNNQIPKKLWAFFNQSYSSLGEFSSSFSHDTLIYVADVSKYCQVDGYKGSVLENDLNQFNYIVNSKYVKKSEIILILNKIDIFRQQLLNGMPFVEFSNEEYRKKYDSLELLIQIGSHECMMAERAVDGFIRNIHGKDECVPWEIIEIVRQYVNRNKQFSGDTEEDIELFDETYKCAIKFIGELFTMQDQLVQIRRIFTMISSATDKDNLERIFWDIQNITIRRGS